VPSKSISEAVRDVADYIEHDMEAGALEIFPGIHESADRRRAVAIQTDNKAVADALRLFAKRSESESVDLSVFVALLGGLMVPDKIRKPAEWAIYDRYGAK
jgi:hypothetical protein